MHELEFASKIIKEAEKQGNVKAVVVEVGDLAHLPLEDLEKTLKEVVDWDVTMVGKKGKVRCGCGFCGEPKIVEKQHSLTVYVCPECGKVPEEVLDGKDIVLKEVVVEN